MVFMCPPKEEAAKRTAICDNLQDLLERVQDKVMIPCQPCGGIPNPSPTDEPVGGDQPPSVMVCYQTLCSKNTKQSNVEKQRVKKSKSRELRASILHTGCTCEKKYGLQDDCQRSDCKGSPACLTKPDPTCGPSEFSNGKHLGKKWDAKAGGKGDKTGSGEDDTVTYHYDCYPAKIFEK